MSGDMAVQPRAGNLTERLFDQFFRRWWIFVLPVLLIGMIGIYVASGVTGEYVSRGRLSASANPLVEQPTVRGTDIGAFESPAAGTARLINEQLRTDSFLDEVASRSGLADLIETGFLERDVIRNQLFAYQAGENILTVEASWGDSQTAFQLVDATITTYLDYVAEVVTTDANEAAEFYASRKLDAEQVFGDADVELQDYIADLPNDVSLEALPTEDRLNLDRLTAAVERANEDVRSAQLQIDDATLQAREVERAAFQKLRTVDAPNVPSEAESTITRQIINVIMFSIIGAIVALVALVAVTLADQSVRSRAQLADLIDTDGVVTVPAMKLPKRRSNRSTTQKRKAA